jgi:hypothetical protein
MSISQRFRNLYIRSEAVGSGSCITTGTTALSYDADDKETFTKVVSFEQDTGMASFILNVMYKTNTGEVDVKIVKTVIYSCIGDLAARFTELGHIENLEDYDIIFQERMPAEDDDGNLKHEVYARINYKGTSSTIDFDGKLYYTIMVFNSPASNMRLLLPGDGTT